MLTKVSVNVQEMPINDVTLLERRIKFVSSSLLRIIVRVVKLLSENVTKATMMN